MRHPSARRAAALALSLTLLLPVGTIAAPAADTGPGPFTWAATAWQRLLYLVASSETPGQPSTGSDLGPAIDPDGLHAADPFDGSDLGPDIDPDGLHADPSDGSDLGPDIDPNG